ncbi:MAG: FMN-binding protein, partial [Clostridiales bacterium]|nr:FMN-binding protein [Clostridiales bacterium]
MPSMIRPAVVLFAICAIVTGALAATYVQTEGAIAESEARVANEIRAQVLPADEFEPVAEIMGAAGAGGDGSGGDSSGTGGGGSGTGGDESASSGASGAYPAVTEFYRGLSGGRTVGYVATVVSKGYGGDVSVIVGIGADGKIAGVRVASHSETPGLGANSTNPEFYSQYDQQDALGGISVVKTAPPGDGEIVA